jgi:chemotaxis protein MotB
LELDSDNRDLQKQLAQTQQQARLYEDQLKVMRQQLEETGNRLAQAIQSQQQSDQQVAALQTNLQRQATLQRRSGATITANSSTAPVVSAIQIAGLNVRQDGDVVRIELPSDQIFLPGTAAINPQSSELLSQVAATIGQHYPRQKIGIEAHTDSSPTQGTQWRNSHQLSAAQAMAVFEQLAATDQFTPRQMFVLGHGPNYPVASNATPDGQQRNRRVEVVIYPEVVD